MSQLFEYIQSLLNQGHEPTDHGSAIYREFGQTVAVMVIDSVGFSRVAQQEGILHFLSQLIRARSVIKHVLEAHEALDIHFDADNVYAIFGHADTALRAADATHQAIAASGVMLTASEPYQVCIGIGYGELLHGGVEGYFGDEMNLASKLGEDIADGAETLITAEVRAAADDSLLDGFDDEFEDIAGIELRFARKKLDPGHA